MENLYQLALTQQEKTQLVFQNVFAHLFQGTCEVGIETLKQAVQISINEDMPIDSEQISTIQAIFSQRSLVSYPL